MTTELS